MNARRILVGVAIVLILFGTVATILAILPQIESLLLALAGRGNIYLALGVAGGLLLFFARRSPPKEETAPRSPA